MKVFLLSDPNSVHTIKWAKSFSSNNIEIMIFGLGDLTVTDYNGIKNIKIKTLGVTVTANEFDSTLYKLRYLKAIPMIKEIIKEFRPDIVHAHYASSYGLIGALSGFSPFILSVWGTDVFSFPNRSILHKMILKFNLKKADKILSTSYAMANETKLYTDKDITITPFGVNMDYFKPMVVKSLFDKNDIVIGTVKSLEDRYGIDYLIRAFKIVNTKLKKFNLKLLIVGSGSLENSLKNLTNNLKIDKQTIFTGKVPFNKVHEYHNMLSISVSVSNSESFGVSIIEASSCGKPVVVSNVGGLPEVVDDEVTGFIVPARDPENTAKAIEKLILDKELRIRIGNNGRKRVKKLYNWEDNVKKVIGIYEEFIF